MIRGQPVQSLNRIVVNKRNSGNDVNGIRNNGKRPDTLRSGNCRYWISSNERPDTLPSDNCVTNGNCMDKIPEP